MTSDAPRQSPRLRLTAGLFLVAIVAGLTLALARFSAPGYAGIGTRNLILEALLQKTPTPIPTPVAAACGVQIVPDMTIATDTVGVDLRNEGAAASVDAITLVWPVSNGELVEIRFGDRPVWSGMKAGGSATVFPSWADLLPTIKSGEQTMLTLRFSDGAVDGQYIVLLHLGKSCYALFDSSQTTPQVQSCFATFDRFRVNEQEVELDVRNTTATPLSLKRLLVFWSDNQAAINSVQIDDKTNLISRPADKSPIDRTLPADLNITLQPEQSSSVKLLFDEQAPLAGYTIALRTNECQSVFSNVEPPSACPVRQEGDLQVVGHTAGLALQNLSETAQPIDRIWLTFPATNGALVDLTLNDASIVDPSSGLFPKSASPATMTAGIDLLPDANLPPNSQSTVGFVFSQNAGLKHYTVELAFPDECRVLATTRAEETVPCQMAVDGETPIRTEGNLLSLAIRNTGETQAELQALQVDWAVQFNGALTRVAIGGAPFWEGMRTEGTATVTHNTDNVVPAIEPGQSVEVQLTFENEATAAPYVFGLEFAEGCRLVYATQPDLAMPSSVTFPGTIAELPANAFDGTWKIRYGSELYSVQVMPQTVIEPRELRPRLNDFVIVQALPLGEDRFLATHIRVTPNAPKPIQLSGVIREVDPQEPPRYIRIPGFTVDIVPGQTVIEGELRIGWIADVDGRRRADASSVLATTIRTRQPEGPPIDFEGVVEEWNPQSDEEALWIVSGMQVKVDQSTVLHGITWGESPELNAEVQVSGSMAGARTVKARELWYGPGVNLIEFSGFIRQLPDDPQLLGIWIVEDSTVGICNLAVNPQAEACRHVLVTNSTFLDISEASPAVDAPVRVRARRNRDGNLEALWIKVVVE